MAVKPIMSANMTATSFLISVVPVSKAGFSILSIVTRSSKIEQIMLGCLIFLPAYTHHKNFAPLLFTGLNTSSMQYRRGFYFFKPSVFIIGRHQNLRSFLYQSILETDKS